MIDNVINVAKEVKNMTIETMDKYNSLLNAYIKFFDVNDDLKKELNNLALQKHGKSLNDLIVLQAKEACKLSDNDFSEHINFINEMNKTPCISDMEVMYSFIYDF